MKNNLFIISGPSGAGEDSVIEGLRKKMPLERVITTTTRKIREGEFQGSPYYFISKKEFVKGINDKLFIEFAQEYNDNYYGVTREEIVRVQNCGKIGIWKIEYKGVISAKKIFPEIKAIFINAPLETLERRIRKRDKISEEYIQERLAYTKEWLKHTDIYDYKIDNLDKKLQKSIERLEEIIKLEIGNNY